MSEYIVQESGYPGTIKKEIVGKLVRCKDCEYGHVLRDENGFRFRLCNHHFGHGLMVEEHGFCKWGKRREDD